MIARLLRIWLRPARAEYRRLQLSKFGQPVLALWYARGLIERLRNDGRLIAFRADPRSLSMVAYAPLGIALLGKPLSEICGGPPLPRLRVIDRTTTPNPCGSRTTLVTYSGLFEDRNLCASR